VPGSGGGHGSPLVGAALTSVGVQDVSPRPCSQDVESGYATPIGSKTQLHAYARAPSLPAASPTAAPSADPVRARSVPRRPVGRVCARRQRRLCFVLVVAKELPASDAEHEQEWTSEEARSHGLVLECTLCSASIEPEGWPAAGDAVRGLFSG